MQWHIQVHLYLPWTDGRTIHRGSAAYDDVKEPIKVAVVAGDGGTQVVNVQFIGIRARESSGFGSLGRSVARCGSSNRRIDDIACRCVAGL